MILSLSAASRGVRIIVVATRAAVGAESIAMGAVAYTSTRSRRRLYLSQALQERREMKEIPQTERDEVREILRGWGYHDADLEELVERICRNPTAELEFMMSFELKLSPVEANAPRASAALVGTATVVGHFIPLSPFFFVGSDVLLGAILAIVLSGIALFGIGWYEAKITVGSWWREGLEMLVIRSELKLSPVEANAPRASAALVGTATVVGHFIPLSPFFFVGSDVLLGAILAIVLSGIALFGIGWYEAKITVGSWWREGLEMLVI